MKMGRARVVVVVLGPSSRLCRASQVGQENSVTSATTGDEDARRSVDSCDRLFVFCARMNTGLFPVATSVPTATTADRHQIENRRNNTGRERRSSQGSRKTTESGEGVMWMQEFGLLEERKRERHMKFADS